MDSREVDKPEGLTIRRRRVCEGCGFRWTTEEVLYTRKVRKDMWPGAIRKPGKGSPAKV